MKALLIRHAASTHQAPDAPLSAEGYAQAERLAPVLAARGAGPLYASPYIRAQATIAPYATASGQQVTILNDLRERLLSPVSLDDWQDHIRRSFQDPDHAPEGGESHNALRSRAGTALAQIAQSGGALPAFVTHGGLTSALFSAIDPSFGFDQWRGLRNPDVFAVTLAEGRITAYERIEMEHET